MVYHVRTYDLRPQSLPEVEERLEGACADAVVRGDLVASFRTEIGRLNQVIQIWRAGDADGRQRALAHAVAAVAAVGEPLLAERYDEITPFDVSPAIPTEPVGPFFEIRRYRYADGDLGHIVAAWEAALPARLELGPLVLVGSGGAQGSSTLLHIWSYRSLDERWALRRTIRAARAWPPHVVAERLGLPGYTLLEMENTIAVPSSFSPLR